MNQWKSKPDWINKWKQTFDDGIWFITEKHFKKLTLTNVGRFKSFHCEFNDFTIILGPHGSGKTTIVSALSQGENQPLMSHKRLIQMHRKNTNQDSNQSIIQIETKHNHDILFNIHKKEIKQNHHCFILDGAGSRLTQERYYQFLTYLQQLPYQIILTANSDYQDIIEQFNMENKNCEIIEIPL